MEAPLLEPKPTTMVSFNSLQTWEERTSDNVEDFPPVHGFKDARFLFVQESKKLWSIATPIAFNILCFYGINSTTQIFVGHLGNLQLSAAAIGLSVISNFSFGFLASRNLYPSIPLSHLIQLFSLFVFGSLMHDDFV